MGKVINNQDASLFSLQLRLLFDSAALNLSALESILRLLACKLVTFSLEKSGLRIKC